MIQMRWLVNGNERTLQYRQIVEKTVHAGPFGKPIEYGAPWGQIPPVNQNWEWTDWQDVPEVVENVNPFRGKCSKCGLAFIGPTSYTCTVTDCPTGLGSST
jgi:hypothetical protein